MTLLCFLKDFWMSIYSTFSWKKTHKNYELDPDFGLLNVRAFKKKGQTKNCSKYYFNHQFTCSNLFAKCNAMSNYAELL